MINEAIDLIATYGMEVIMLALIINLLTNIAKKPLKAFSKKSGKSLNKYISLMPIIFGFIIATLYQGLLYGLSAINISELCTIAMSSASLSLAVFAVFEKFFARTVNKETTETKTQKKIDECVICDAKACDIVCHNKADRKKALIMNSALECMDVPAKIILGNRSHEN